MDCKKMKLLEEICADAMLVIFGFVDPIYLCTELRLVSKRFCEIITKSDLWEDIIKREKIKTPKDFTRSPFELFCFASKKEFEKERILHRCVRHFTQPFISKYVKRKDISVLTVEEIKGKCIRDVQYKGEDKIYRVIDSAILQHVPHWSGKDQYEVRNGNHDVFAAFRELNRGDAGEWLIKRKFDFEPVGNFHPLEGTLGYDPWEMSTQEYYTPWKEINHSKAECFLTMKFSDYQGSFHPRFKMVKDSEYSSHSEDITEEEKEEFLKFKPEFVEDSEKLMRYFLLSTREDTRYFKSTHISTTHLDMGKDKMLCIIDSSSVCFFWKITLRHYG